MFGTIGWNTETHCPEWELLKNCNYIQTGCALCNSTDKRRGHLKIKLIVSQYIYNWVLHHTQVLQYTIPNN